MSTPAFSFACIGCGSSVAASIHDLESRCCGLPFEVRYSGPASTRQPRLPLAFGGARVTLGEGYTPVLELKKSGRAIGVERLWAKLENVAPTGSFKDRGSAVLVSAALQSGIAEFVEDSSGNAGASLAAYAAAGGLKAHVFVPASAAQGKLDQISVFGAALHPVGGARQAATDAARRFAADRSLPYMSHNLSPYFTEGMKSVAYEVAASEAAEASDIVFPVGNGSLLVGAHRGFIELAEAGGAAARPAGAGGAGSRGAAGGNGWATSGMPRLHAVQATAVQPVVRALAGSPSRQPPLPSAPAPRPPLPTVASGIAVSHPPRLRQVVAAVTATGGRGVAVADADILRWQRRLAAAEGIFCEATSAAAFAGLEALVRAGHIPASARVLVPVTGSGLKEPLRPESGTSPASWS